MKREIHHKSAKAQNEKGGEMNPLKLLWNIISAIGWVLIGCSLLTKRR